MTHTPNTPHTPHTPVDRGRLIRAWFVAIGAIAGPLVALAAVLLTIGGR